MRELVVALGILVALYLAYRIRATLAPIGVAFLLSYAVEPPVVFLRERFRVPRGLSAALCVIALLAGASAFWIWAGPEFAQQINALIDRLPRYVEVVRAKLGMDAAALDEFVNAIKGDESEGVKQAVQFGDLAFAGGKWLFGVVGTVTTASIYAVVALFLLIVFFFIFVTYQGWEKPIERVIPQKRRAEVKKVLGYMDRALGAYVRGQILVALFTLSGFALGFWLVDVPYWFVVALIGGVFSLVPYGQLIGLIGAVTLKFFESQTGDVSFSWWGVLLTPMLVYGVTQSMESWVITPLVQGEINKLHPAVILAVLVLGGSLAGVVGLILAIPVAATVKASVREFVIQR